MNPSTKPFVPARLAVLSKGLAVAALFGGAAQALAADDFYWGNVTATGFDTARSDLLPSGQARTYTFTRKEETSITRAPFDADKTDYSPTNGVPARLSLSMSLFGPADGTATVNVTGYLDAVFNGTSSGTGANSATTVGGILSGGVETRLAPGFESFFDRNAEAAYVEAKSPFVDTAENYSSGGKPPSMHHQLVAQSFQVRPGTNTVDLTADLLANAFARGSTSTLDTSRSDVTSTMTFTVSVVPEPSGAALLLGGLPLLVLVLRRKLRRC